jgi:hypothetical protein
MTFVFHFGKVSMHRVTMSFNSDPNKKLNEYTRKLYFGK